jgi:hypothetical protein
MNKPLRILLIFAALTVCAIATTLALTQVGKHARGEEFFIIASVDLQKSQLLMKRPTEVTLLMLTNDRTEISAEDGKRIKLGELRSGDTVWVVVSPAPDGKQLALHIRKGPMTVAELHRLYLGSHTPR